MNKIQQRLNFFGYYQLIGGALGIIMVLNALITRSFMPFYLVVIFLMGFVFQSFSVYCGYLFYKQQYIKAINLSVINQFLQVLNINILGFSFFCSSGFYLCPGLDLTGDVVGRLHFGISTFNLGLSKNHEIIEIGFNVVAFIMMNMLFSLKDKLEKIMNNNVEVKA